MSISSDINPEFGNTLICGSLFTGTLCGSIHTIYYYNESDPWVRQGWISFYLLLLMSLDQSSIEGPTTVKGRVFFRMRLYIFSKEKMVGSMYVFLFSKFDYLLKTSA